MTTGKTIALTIWTFVGKGMSLLFNMPSMEKAMAPHSNTLAWKISWTEEPGRLQSMGSQGARHDRATLHLHSLTTLLTKARLVKARVFPGVMYGWETWSIKKAEY